MAEHILTVHNSKLTYATIKKMISLIQLYINLKSALIYYFPEIVTNSTEWGHLKTSCELFLQKNSNWFGTSPGSSNAGQTVSISSNQVNTSSIQNLYVMIGEIVTFSAAVDFEDMQVWSDILTKIISILSIETEYTLHRQLFNNVKDEDATVDKDPEQLSIYNDCEFPLPTNSQYPEKANYFAFREVLTDDTYYSEFPIYDVDKLITDLGFNKVLSYNVVKVIASSSTYIHTTSVGYVIKATEVSTGTNLPIITYTAHDTVVIGGYSSPTELRLIELSAVSSTTTGAVPIIERPDEISPDAGIGVYTPLTMSSTSFAVSGASFDLHTKSHWEIASDSGFVTVVYSSLNDNVNLTSYTWDPSSTLSASTTYYWRVKYTGATYGDSLWSNGASFLTPSTWSCTLGGLISGGISTGEINSNCIIVGKYDSQPTGTNLFDITTNQTTQLALSGSSGDFTYRNDVDTYYISTWDGITPATITMSEWQEVIPQDEPNDDLYVSSEEEQIALTVVIGNIAVRTDTNVCYINITGSNTAMSDWLAVDVEVKIWWLAKQYCLDLSYSGYTDWYLPTASELDLMYDNLITIDSADTTGNFDTWMYWSSTADVYSDKYNAWSQDFNTGIQTNYDRDTKWFYVRPVRRL